MRVLLIDKKPPARAVLSFDVDLSALNVEWVADFDEAAATAAAARDIALVLVQWAVWQARREMDPQCNLATMFPDIPVLVIVDAVEAAEGGRALAEGARHYLSRTAGQADLHAALRQLLSLVAPQRDEDQRETAGDPNAVTARLTAREKEVVALLLGGRSNKEIGRELSVSDGTIKAHLHNIMRKLDVRNRIELIHKLRGWEL